MYRGYVIDLTGPRRQAANGCLYFKDEFLEWYGPERGESEWENARIAEEFNWDVDPTGILGAVPWP